MLLMFVFSHRYNYISLKEHATQKVTIAQLLLYIVEPFHRQLAFRMEFIGIWKNLFPFSDPSSALFSCCLTFKHFIIIRLKCVAVLVFTCCAAPISLRVVDSLRHTHAFSRVTLREFLVKWATMAAPMVSENVRFKIKFMVYNILTKLNKKYICYNILSWMVCGNWGNFNAFSTLWLHVPLR